MTSDELKRAGLWTLYASMLGAALATGCVLAFRAFDFARPLVSHLFSTLGRPAFAAASWVTDWFYPGDLLYRVVWKDRFFDVALILATTVQCALLGFCSRLIIARTNRHAPRA